jgi:hypothetical protein
MIHDGKQIWIEKKSQQKNLTNKKTMDFWMIRFGLYFQKSKSWSIFVGLIFFFPNMYNKKFFRWAHFHMDFINWLIIT